MKKQKSNRIPTYIPNFDSLINGGFKKNSINLIVGGAGSGKTIFTLQFLVNGILKHNETGFRSYKNPTRILKISMNKLKNAKKKTIAE